MRGWLLAMAMLLAGAPGLAQAQERGLTDSFQTLCMATQAKPDAALTLAKADGYVVPPPKIVAALAEQAGKMAPNAQMRWKVVDGRILVLVTGAGPMASMANLTANYCGVLVSPAGDPEAMLTALLGVGPASHHETGTALFAYGDDGGKRTPVSLDNLGVIASLVQSGQARVALAVTKPEMDLGGMVLVIPQAQ
jgi:hypothetical protein